MKKFVTIICLYIISTVLIGCNNTTSKMSCYRNEDKQGDYINTLGYSVWNIEYTKEVVLKITAEDSLQYIGDKNKAAYFAKELYELLYNTDNFDGLEGFNYTSSLDGTKIESKLIIDFKKVDFDKLDYIYIKDKKADLGLLKSYLESSNYFCN